MMKVPGISVCFVVKNGMTNGYPFWESLQSCLPIADEIVISEGYSKDETMKVIDKFSMSNKKVRVLRHNWENIGSGNGEVISKVSMMTMAQCRRQWVYYLQADEIIHQDNYDTIRKVANGSFGSFNSVNFQFSHFIGSWDPIPVGGAAYSYAIRMVKNIPSIHLIGDAWTFGGAIAPVFPHEKVPKPIYHLAWVFPKNMDNKCIEQAKIYRENPTYQKKAQDALNRIASGTGQNVGFPHPSNLSDLPESLKRLVGQYEYTLPPGVL